MKVLSTQSAILTNAEVLTHLNAVHERYSSQSHPDYVARSGVPKGRLTEFREVVEEARRYLMSPRSRIAMPGAEYTEASFRRLMQRLQPYGFTKPELINIMNIRPKNFAELDPCVEELEQRTTEDDVDEIIKIIAEELGEEQEADADGGSREKEPGGGADEKGKVNGEAMEVDR